MTIKAKHPNGYFGILYGKSSMAIYDEFGHQILHTGFRNINTQDELYKILEDAPKLSKLAKAVLEEGGQDGTDAE